MKIPKLFYIKKKIIIILYDCVIIKNDILINNNKYT